MSYDRQIDQVCQHTVMNEALFFSSDQRTIVPVRAIGAGRDVQLYLNGAIQVPSSGIRLPPTVVGTLRGPYNVQTGVNDTFQVLINQEATPRQLVLPSLTGTSAETLVKRLNAGNLGLQFFVDAGRVAFKSYSSGDAASVFVTAASTLAGTLGITCPREYRGTDLYPGWSLVVAPRVLDYQAKRYIVFDKPLRGSQDFVEISYTTTQQECRRCGGTGVENDWRYTRTGDVVEVRDEALLIQELLKIFYTQSGTNPFHPWYGTRLIDQVGKKLGVTGVLQNLITSDLSQAFTRWQSIKRQQEQVVGQEVSDEEYPFRLLSVGVQQSSSDPTVFFVNVTVMNRSMQPLQIERGIRIPEPADLLSSTQQQGIFRQSLNNYVLAG